MVGFCCFREDGYIKGLYVSPNWQGKGIGQIMLTECLMRLNGVRASVIASSISKLFFEKFGFHLVANEVSQHNGAEFTRFVMELEITK